MPVLERASCEYTVDALKEQLFKEQKEEQEEQEPWEITVPKRSFVDPLRRNPNKSIEVVREVRRNDPCPCSSGKKAKFCHGVGKEYKEVVHSLKGL